MSRPLTDRGRKIIARTLTAEKKSLPSTQERRNLLVDYLEQEGFSDPKSFGFVDIGWKGTIHGLLCDVLLQEGMISDPLPGFFFGLKSPQQHHGSTRSAYFFDRPRQAGFETVLAPSSSVYTILETFCTANHGTVTGYQKKGGAVRPTLEPTWSRRMEAWGLPIIDRTISSFLDGLTQHTDRLHPYRDVRPALADVLRLFWQTPTREEAEAWGAFPRETGQSNEQDTTPLAERYEWTALPCFARYGQQAHRTLRAHFTWPQASLASSSPRVRRAIGLTLRGRRFTKKVIRKLSSLFAT
jgi:hypothetical protein